jgi:xylan 1,4-beta-xylosidase
VPSSGGIYAPTLRHHQGWFYMVTTNVQGGGHFYVKARDPAGPWSEPVWIAGPWFDPDLFFDDDGTVYFARMNMGRGIYQREIDLETGELLGPERIIWPGFEDRFCEAPHIYKIDGVYYLLVAEGGTHRSHMIVVARSSSPTGPYEGCPHNPLLTHRCKLASPIEHAGHGDLIQAPDGSWWIVFLAVRTYHGRFHLGRETFLAPVAWTEDGWPVINGGWPVALEMDAALPTPHPWPEPPVRDDFLTPDLALCWNFRRNPDPDSWSLAERTGWLRLRGTFLSLDDSGPLAFVGRRQQHFCCRARTQMSFDPALESQEAGLTVLMNEEHHYEIALTVRGGRRVVLLRKRIGDLSVEVAARPFEGSSVVLEIAADHERYTFSYGRSESELAPVGTGLVRYLSQHVAGGFTGVYLAMYATGNGQPCDVPADFDWFDYEPLQDEVALGWSKL